MGVTVGVTMGVAGVTDLLVFHVVPVALLDNYHSSSHLLEVALLLVRPKPTK